MSMEGTQSQREGGANIEEGWGQLVIKRRKLTNNKCKDIYKECITFCDITSPIFFN